MELKKLFEEKPKILWYPSCGEDLHPLLYFDKKLVGKLLKNFIEPDLFVFTDYRRRYNDLFSGKKQVLFQDDRTKIDIEKVEDLIFDPELDYTTEQSYIAFPEHSSPKPSGYYYHLDIKSDVLGNVKRKLLYLFFENVCFFREYICKMQLEVPYLYHYQDGAGLGGSRVRFNWLYYFFPMMKTRGLVSNSENRGDHTNFLENKVFQPDLNNILNREVIIKEKYTSQEHLLKEIEIKRLGSYEDLEICENKGTTLFEISR